MDTGKFGLPSFVTISPSFAEVLKMKRDFAIMCSVGEEKNFPYQKKSYGDRGRNSKEITKKG